MTEGADVQPASYLERFVALFNTGVRTHDFSQFLEYFSDDAVLEYDGVPDPPLLGKPAIVQRYRDDPPDDQIRVVRWKAERDRITAEFRWNDIPEARGGCFVIDRRGEKISHLTVAFGGPATRCFK
ncbi:MAG TPA: nuclear transport factor 2 family protein [Candidatus Baltobacteraceae bacterium]|jgi:hypothetical protein|nr:nuclear transport factor 2 family protein [Candidatus Baltobacteraceae bacterium]